jgi:hypothetical protein
MIAASKLFYGIWLFSIDVDGNIYDPTSIFNGQRSLGKDDELEDLLSVDALKDLPISSEHSIGQSGSKPFVLVSLHDDDEGIEQTVYLALARTVVKNYGAGIVPDDKMQVSPKERTQFLSILSKLGIADKELHFYSIAEY